MKILQIIGNMGSGGAEKLLLDSLPLYRKNGIEMDLLVLNGKEYPFLKALKETGCCKIHSLGSSSIYNPINCLKIIPFLRKYDIVQVHLFPSQYWVVLAKIISFSKIKLLLTEHSTSNPRMKNYFIRGIDKFIYRFYDKIICVKEEVFQIIYNYIGESKSKFEVIENGIDLEKFYAAKPYSKGEISNLFCSEDILLIQVSRFCFPKDQETTIKSLQYLPQNVKLVLVGDGELKKNCENLVQKLNLSDRVLFLGLRMDVPELLKTADISILSTFHEGFPLVALEAMAVGKPLIASDVSGVSDVVQNAGILFEKENAKELAVQVMKLINNPEYYLEIAASCKERAKKNDIQHMVEKHIALYKSLF